MTSAAQNPLQDPVIDPGRCPLCGQPNGCAMERQRISGMPQAPCWCASVDFAPGVLARVPAAARQRACICAACAGGGGEASEG